MFNNPAALIPIIAAAVLYITAILIIVYHRTGLELVGLGMIFLAIVWIVYDHLNVLPWILFLSGIAIHGSGRAKRWWKIGQKRKRDGKDDENNRHEGNVNGH